MAHFLAALWAEKHELQKQRGTSHSSNTLKKSSTASCQVYRRMRHVAQGVAPLMSLHSSFEHQGLSPEHCASPQSAPGDTLKASSLSSMASPSTKTTSSSAAAAGGGGGGGGQSGRGEAVIVVGGGLAGLTAASEIAAQGGSVIILEKTDRLGGNSAKASSGMNAAGSVEQEAAGITDSPALLVADTVRSGKGLSSEALVDTVATHSADAVRFLSGFNLNLSDILQLGGHSRARTHRAAADGKPMNIGYRIMSTLISHLQQLQDSDPSWVRILVNSRALQLLTSEEEKEGGGVQTRVVGVRVEKQKV